MENKLFRKEIEHAIATVFGITREQAEVAAFNVAMLLEQKLDLSDSHEGIWEDDGELVKVMKDVEAMEIQLTELVDSAIQ